jgi:hypothetical protein
MGLSAEEKATLEALSKKAQEPDGPPAGVSFNLDLSNDTAWERAKKLGLIRDDPTPDEGEPEPDAAPKRRGYFGEA